MAKKFKNKILHKSNTAKNTVNMQINVKNAEGEANTSADILVQNRINYTPKVSVIIPVYNVAPYLPECLDSVTKQTLKEIEIICVDDGSTDDSVEILKEYANKDPRITVIVQKNLHAGVARNAGLTVAKGKYLSFLDSDDFFAPTLLEENYKIAEKENVDLVFYQYHTYNNETKEIERTGGINFECPINDDGYGVVSVKDVADRIFTMCNPMPWNKLIRKELIDKNQVRFQSLTASNDVYFSLVALACSDKIALFYKPFVYYRHNRKDSLKNNRDKNPFNFYEAYKGVYNTLKNKNLYEDYKSSFLRTLVSSSFWTMEHTDVMRTTVRNFIKERIVPEFNITGSDKELLPKHLIDKLNRLEEPEIIISLTSFPARIGTVNQTIESLLNQTLKADRVVLWLAPEQFPNKEADLPHELLELRERGLTIDWYHDIRSYKKLIPALKKYPDAIIVTADDDLIFKNTWLALLYSAYLNDKTKIWSHRITRLYRSSGKMHILDRSLYLDENGAYKKELKAANAFNKLTGGAGSLYPPKSLHPDVMDEDAFMKLAPTSDDIWFWIQAIRNGYKVAVVDNNQYKLQYVPGSQEESLYKVNDAGGHKVFFEHLNNIMATYKDVEDVFNADQKENERALKAIKQKLANRYKDQLCDWYKRVTGHYLNLDNPKRFNEKIQWLKLYASTPIKTKLADKFLVRDWVKEKIGEKYLIPLLGVYDKFEDIDFSKLPDRFVIKCNHGCAYNIIVKDKSKLDLAEVKAKLDKWMSEDFSSKWGYELQYRDIVPKIIIEKYIENKNTGGDLYDYKFWCFNGHVEYIQFLSERNLDGLKMAFYDRNWKKQSFVYSHPLDKKNIKKPDNLSLMIELAEKLSRDFNHVRVDFYRLDDGTIYFGEMTFTSASGICNWNEEKINKYFGHLIKLPKLAYNIDTGEYYKLQKKSRLEAYLLFPYYLYKLTQAKKEYKRLMIKSIEKQLLAFRLDVKNIGEESNNIDVVAPSARVSKPLWMKNAQGQGVLIEGNSIEQKITLTVIKDGLLRFAFKASDRKFNNERFPVYVDYTSIKIDKNEILKSPIKVWHNTPFIYEMPVKDGQVIEVEIKQQLHKYEKGELRDVIFKLNPKSSFIHNNIDTLMTGLGLTEKKEVFYENINELPNIDLDLCVPLGNACRPAFWLRKFGLRQVALPFDWLGLFSLDVVVRSFDYSISEWFSSFFEQEPKNKEKNKKRIVVSTNVYLRSSHHFPKSVSVEEYLPEFRRIFVERQQRMLNLLRTKETVCFVANRLEDTAEIVKFLKEVRSHFPNIHNLTFINVRHSDTDKSIKLYNISDNIKLYEITDYDIHQDGADGQKNPKFWIGNEDLWTNVCSKLHLKNDKTPENYKKKIKLFGLNFYVTDKKAEIVENVRLLRDELERNEAKIEQLEKDLTKLSKNLEDSLNNQKKQISTDILSIKSGLSLSNKELIERIITAIQANTDGLKSKLSDNIHGNIGLLKQDLIKDIKGDIFDLQSSTKEQIKYLSDKLHYVAGTLDKSLQEHSDISSSIASMNDSLKETFVKNRYNLRTVIDLIETLITEINENIDYNFDALPDKIERKQRAIATISSEPYWANIYHDTIINSTWLKDKSVSPGRWAVSYIVLYVLYRVLNEFRPKNILECGLGQSSKLTSQYAEANSTQLTICEDNQNWVKFFKTNFPVVDKYVHLLGLEMVEVVKPYKSRTYKDFKNLIRGEKFDFVIVDGPLGSPRYSRPELLDIVDNLAQSFVIMLDDMNRDGEQDTWELLKDELTKRGIPFREKIYASDKSVGLICSDDLQFLTSL